MNGFESTFKQEDQSSNGSRSVLPTGSSIHVATKRLNSNSTSSFENNPLNERLRSNTSSDLPCTWPNVPSSGYDFESYSNHNSSPCCLPANSNTNSSSGYYYSPSNTELSNRSGPCKPTPNKFWPNSSTYESSTGPSSDPLVAAAVCHGSAFAAAAAHHAAANHVAAAAWCNYSSYHQTGRPEPSYLNTEAEHRNSFVDNYPATVMRPFSDSTSTTAPLSSYHQGQPGFLQTSTTGGKFI
jgi:hypothetical protein